MPWSHSLCMASAFSVRLEMESASSQYYGRASERGTQGSLTALLPVPPCPIVPGRFFAS